MGKDCFVYAEKGNYAEFTIYKKDFVKIKLIKNKETKEFLEALYQSLNSCKDMELEIENKKRYMAIIANFRKGNILDAQAIYFGKTLLRQIMIKIKEGVDKK